MHQQNSLFIKAWPKERKEGGWSRPPRLFWGRVQENVLQFLYLEETLRLVFASSQEGLTSNLSSKMLIPIHSHPASVFLDKMTVPSVPCADPKAGHGLPASFDYVQRIRPSRLQSWVLYLFIPLYTCYTIRPSLLCEHQATQVTSLTFSLTKFSLSPKGFTLHLDGIHVSPLDAETRSSCTGRHVGIRKKQCMYSATESKGTASLPSG